MNHGFIYILTNKNHTTLYVGVTSHIVQRINQHRNGVSLRGAERCGATWQSNSFTAKYNLTKLVYYEAFQEIGDAIGREKQIKAGSREAKNELIRILNPTWNDLFEEIKDIMTE